MLGTSLPLACFFVLSILLLLERHCTQFPDARVDCTSLVYLGVCVCLGAAVCKPTCHNVQVPLRVISGLLLLAIFGSIADAAPHNLSCSRVLRLDKPVSGLLLLA